jgi:hypothetical protein
MYLRGDSSLKLQSFVKVILKKREVTLRSLCLLRIDAIQSDGYISTFRTHLLPPYYTLKMEVADS